MEVIVDDVIINIAQFLTNNHKLTFLSTSKKFHLLKNKVHYDEAVDIDKVYKLPYYDMFTNVFVNDLAIRLPKSIIKLGFGVPFDYRIKTYFSNTFIKNLTHLYFTYVVFDKCQNISVNRYIPK